MALTTDNIRLRQAAKNTDDDDAGGLMGQAEVADGALNNLFSDKSRLDKTLGRVSIRPVYTFVNSQDDDPYLGHHYALASPPEDEQINVFLYAARDDAEERLAVENRIAVFETRRGGLVPDSVLVGDSAAGTQQITIAFPNGAVTATYLRTHRAGELVAVSVAPDSRIQIGTLIVLDDGTNQQIVEVENVGRSIGANFVTEVLQLRQPLRFDFEGTADSALSGFSQTKIYYGTPGAPSRDDVRYYGITPPSSQILSGATTIDVPASIQQIAPPDPTFGDVVGLTPVALNEGYRVPIFRVGDGVLMHHTDETVLPNPVVAGNTYSIGRTNLDFAEVRDANGLRVFSDRFTLDLAAGEVTFANPLDLEDYVQPLKVVHMIENRAQIRALTVAVATWNLGPLSALDVGVAYQLNAGNPVGEVTVVTFGPFTLGASRYTVDLVAGTFTLTPGFSYSGNTIYGEDLIVATLLPATTLTLDRPVAKTLPDDGNTYVSTILPIGDLQSGASFLHTQQTWTGVWSDEQIGAGTTGQFDAANHPITTINAGAVTDRWRLQFTSVTAFDVVSERRGVVGTGDVFTDTEILNPTTGHPYFTLPSAGFGEGWNIGNVVRFNTRGATSKINVIRSTMPGDDTVEPTDNVRLLVRGDAKAE